MEKTQVLIKTIEKMAQFMRDYPPAEMPENPNEILLYGTALWFMSGRFIIEELGEY